ncbi:MAG: MarR family transcriptional regulator [Saprospiraceae bacterium]|nr:MarR family transcriptional regulator [Saprospiraceae bacterium]
MKPDFVAELEYLGLSVRLKRISETMVHGGRNLYRQLGLDIEPNWYLLLLLLKEHKQLSITEMAEYLRFSHPSIIGMVKKMKSRGYLESSTDKKDSRRQLVELSAKAKAELPRLERIWEAGERGVRKLFDVDDDFLDKLARLEQQYVQFDFMERTLKELENEQ